MHVSQLPFVHSAPIVPVNNAKKRCFLGSPCDVRRVGRGRKTEQRRDCGESLSFLMQGASQSAEEDL